MNEDFLSEKIRAEDIILGSLGFGEEAKIISISKDEDGFSGVGVWEDGEEFSFKSEDKLTELEIWAVETLLGNKA